jgi:Spy/CpxP family protein refolding chaperone
MFTQQGRVRLVAGTGGVLVVAALLVTLVAEVSAQGPSPGRAGRGGPGVFGGPGGSHGDSALGGGFRSLSTLTEAQREQLRSVAGQHRQELATLARQVADARRALTASAQTGQVDEGTATELGAATGALALARAKAQAEAFAVLTPEQRAELATKRDQMRQWMQARPGGDSPGRRGRAGRGRQ